MRGFVFILIFSVIMLLIVSIINVGLGNVMSPKMIGAISIGSASLINTLLSKPKLGNKAPTVNQSDNNGKAEIPEEYKDLKLNTERRSQRKKEAVNEGEVPVDYKNIKIKPKPKSRRKKRNKKESEASVKYKFYAHMAPNKADDEEE